MATVDIPSYEIANLFGLTYLDWDYVDSEDTDRLYQFTWRGVPFSRKDYGYKEECEVVQEVAQEVLWKIGKLIDMN